MNELLAGRLMEEWAFQSLPRSRRRSREDMDDDLYELWQQLLIEHDSLALAKIAARLLGEVVTLRRLCGNLEVELSRLYGLLREREERRAA